MVDAIPGKPVHDARCTSARQAASVQSVEFSAVIQEIIVTPDATTIHLDVATPNISTLAELVDQELSITARLTNDPEAQPSSTKQPPSKGTSPECA